jgi:hypothetical protein
VSTEARRLTLHCDSVVCCTQAFVSGIPCMRTACVIGGVPLPPQLHRLRTGAVQVVVATPGRAVQVLADHPDDVRLLLLLFLLLFLLLLPLLFWFAPCSPHRVLLTVQMPLAGVHTVLLDDMDGVLGDRSLASQMELVLSQLMLDRGTVQVLACVTSTDARTVPLIRRYAAYASRSPCAALLAVSAPFPP